MRKVQNYLAVDLGAESGRTIAGTLDTKEERLDLTETYRFANGPVRLPDGMHWDVLRLWAEIKNGITASAGKLNGPLACIGVDSWGCDFALLDKNKSLLSNPFHYRDARTGGMLEEAFRRMPRAEIFANTGIQFMQINTLYQLLAMSLKKSPLFDVAEDFVTIPDLINYWLTGIVSNEFTNATTTQCLNPKTRDWARPVLDALEIPLRFFGPITESGSLIGTLLPDVAEETGTSAVSVVAPACHDTGSAVVAVPAEKGDFVWISSGTWSVMGAEVNHPHLDEKALQFNFTNEGGVFETWRLSKNVMGLWLVQECRRTWQRSGDDLSYDEITHLATEAKPFLAILDPDDPEFLHPGDMPKRIRQFCLRTGQAVPETKGEIVRVALEAIALKYRWVLEKLEDLIGRQLQPIHIIGGGTQNRLLNQFTADSTGRTVTTGPIEATAIGNILMQAIGLGQIGSLVDARAIVRTSFNPEIYYPTHRDGWDEAYEKLVNQYAATTIS